MWITDISVFIQIAGISREIPKQCPVYFPVSDCIVAISSPKCFDCPVCHTTHDTADGDIQRCRTDILHIRKGNHYPQY